jgi:hypothetical protein
LLGGSHLKGSRCHKRIFVVKIQSSFNFRDVGR